MNAWECHLRPVLAELHAYDVAPADARYARLHTNECAEPWPPEAVERIAQAVAKIELGRYPDTSGRELRARLAARHGCDPGQIILGNGSDEVIGLILLALSGHAGPGDAGALVIPRPTFVMYGHTAKVLGMPVREVDLDAQFQLVEGPLRRALDGAAVCFLARPNNPTGSLWDAALIGRLIADHPSTVFVIDEAYGAYAPGTSMFGREAPSNQVHMATFSKIGGAAIRLGYCVAHLRLAEALDKVRHPYNISATSLAIATLMLDELKDEQDRMVGRALANRARLAQLLAHLPRAQVFPSAGNMIIARLGQPHDASRLTEHLAQRGVLIKDVSRQPGLEGCVRVSIGTTDELDRLEAGIASFPAHHE